MGSSSTRRHSPPTSLSAYLAGPPAVSQRALADAVGCNQSMISMLVRGKRVPSAGLMARLHAVTGVPLRLLLASKLGPLTRPRRRRPPRSGGTRLAQQGSP